MNINIQASNSEQPSNSETLCQHYKVRCPNIDQQNIAHVLRYFLNMNMSVIEENIRFLKNKIQQHDKKAILTIIEPFMFKKENIVNDTNMINIGLMIQTIKEALTELNKYKDDFKPFIVDDNHRNPTGVKNLYELFNKLNVVKTDKIYKEQNITTVMGMLKGTYTAVLDILLQICGSNPIQVTYTNIDNAITEEKFNEITSIEYIKKESLPDARQVMCIQRFSHYINGTSDKCTYLFHGVGTGKTITSTSIALNYLIKNKEKYCYDIKTNIIENTGQKSEPVCPVAVPVTVPVAVPVTVPVAVPVTVPVGVPVNQNLVVEGQRENNTTSDNPQDIEFKILIVAPPGIFRTSFIQDFKKLGIITLNTVVFKIPEIDPGDGEVGVQSEVVDQITVETVDGFYKLHKEYYDLKIHPGSHESASDNKLYKIKFIGCDYTNFFKKNSRKILLEQYPNINVVIFDEAHRLLNNKFVDTKYEVLVVDSALIPQGFGVPLKEDARIDFSAMADFELYDFCKKIEDKVIYLTGTPFQKSPMDIVTILKHINFLNYLNDNTNWQKFSRKLRDVHAWEPMQKTGTPLYRAYFSFTRMINTDVDWEIRGAEFTKLILQCGALLTEFADVATSTVVATEIGRNVLQARPNAGSHGGEVSQMNQFINVGPNDKKTKNIRANNKKDIEKLLIDITNKNRLPTPEHKTDTDDGMFQQIEDMLKTPTSENFKSIIANDVVFKLTTKGLKEDQIENIKYEIMMVERIIYGKLLKELLISDVFKMKSDTPRVLRTGGSPNQIGGEPGLFDTMMDIARKTWNSLMLSIKKFLNLDSIVAFIKNQLIISILSEILEFVFSYSLEMGYAVVLAIGSKLYNIGSDAYAALLVGWTTASPHLIPCAIMAFISWFTIAMIEMINDYYKYDYSSFLESTIDYVSIYNYDFNKYAIDKTQFYSEENKEYNYTVGAGLKSKYSEFYTNAKGNKNSFPIKHIQYIFMPYSCAALIKFVENEGERIDNTTVREFKIAGIDTSYTKLSIGCNVKINCGMTDDELTAFKSSLKQKYLVQEEIYEEYKRKNNDNKPTNFFLNYRDPANFSLESPPATAMQPDANFISTNTAIITSNKDILTKLHTVIDKGSLFSAAIETDYNRFEHILILLKIMKLGLIINNINNFDCQPHYCIKFEKPDVPTTGKLHYYLPVFYPTTSDIMISFIDFLNQKEYKYIWLNEDDKNEQIAINYDTGSKETFPIHNIVEQENNTLSQILDSIDKSQPICIILSPTHTEGFSFTKNPAIILPALCKTAGDSEQVYGRVLRKYSDHQTMNKRYIKQIYQYYGSNVSNEKDNLQYWNTLYGFGWKNPNLIFKDALMVEKLTVNTIDDNITPTVSDTTDTTINLLGYQLRHIWINKVPNLTTFFRSAYINGINVKFNEYMNEKLANALGDIEEMHLFMIQNDSPEMIAVEKAKIYTKLAKLILHTASDIDQLNNIYKINLVAAKYFVKMAAPENNSFKEDKIIPMDRAMLLKHKNYLQLVASDYLSQPPPVRPAGGGKMTKFTRRKKDKASGKSTRRKNNRVIKSRRRKIIRNKHTKKFA
jgi:hypothetical protein